MIYRAAPPDCVRAVALDSLWAVYHRPSGQTHIVTAPVVAILAALGDTALSLSDIAARIDLADDCEAVAAHLAEMTTTGLVTGQ